MQQTAETTVAIQETLNDVADAITALHPGSNDLTRRPQQQDLRKWLSPPDPLVNHDTAFTVHHKSTAAWFFEGSVFNEWKSTPSLLWIHGKGLLFLDSTTPQLMVSIFVAGSGKSVLWLVIPQLSLPYELESPNSSSIVEHLMALRDAGLASMGYFYFDFRDEDKQSCDNLIRSLLFQLSAQSGHLSNILSHLYLAHENGKQKPNCATLTRCFKEMLSLADQGPIYLIVDAVDECPDSSGMPSPREQVLELIEELVNLRLPNLHLCVTSRPEVDIRTTLEGSTTVSVSLHEQSGQKKDIIDYINSVVYSDAKMQRWREEDKKLVVETLTRKADGM
jgi:NACHT domain